CPLACCSSISPYIFSCFVIVLVLGQIYEPKTSKTICSWWDGYDNGDEAHYQSVPYLSVDKLEKSKLSIYPNPVKDQLYIENLTENVQIEIYDLSGKEMLIKELNKTNRQVNVSQLSTGVYFYGLSQNGKMVKTGKLIKN
ncbi:MAG TPA: T9SS type A sorting domain-containing protein, partial [Flavobacteriaceae bacterium]|nr:T9SS type A sorting domain-containing protein [Flavobacteriaceae bacterium]